MAERLPSVLIIEDHALLSESLALALRLRDFEHVDMADPNQMPAEAIIAHVERTQPEVVLLDLFLGDAGSSIPLIPPISALGVKVLVLTASQDRVMLGRCIEAGALGVFDKAQAFDTLIESLTDAALGRAPMRPAAREELLTELADHRRGGAELGALFDRLTQREKDVLVAIIDGATADEIAASQVVALSTVRSHIRAILEKLGVNSQLAAVALARRAGWPPAT